MALQSSDQGKILFDFSKTAEDTFGRIESEHCVTAANAFKMEGFHSLLILKNHDPRRIAEDQFLDAMDVAMKWSDRLSLHCSLKKLISLIKGYTVKCNVSEQPYVVGDAVCQHEKVYQS